MSGRDVASEPLIAAGVSSGSTDSRGLIANSSAAGGYSINKNAALKLYKSGIITVGEGIDESNAGISGVGSSASSVRFWAGNTHANRDSAPFRVYNNGDVVATNGTFAGNVTCTSLIAQNIDSNSFSIPGLKAAIMVNTLPSPVEAYFFRTKGFIAKVTRAATGRYRINFTPATTAYAPVCQIYNSTTNIGSAFRGNCQIGFLSSGQFDVMWFDTDGNAHDINRFIVYIFSY